MPKKPEQFTSLDAVPEIPKDEQTRAWTLFYVAVNGGNFGVDDCEVHSLQDVISANLGEPADEAIIRQTLENLKKDD